MAKVKPLSPNAVLAARRVLDECGVRHPLHIDVPAIAARYGMMLLYATADTARASIVRAGDRAVVAIDETARGTPRERFAGAHELGHMRMHEVVDHFTQCHGETTERTGTDWAVERDANHFAAEFLMPEAMTAPLCACARPTIDDVDRLARRFRVSLESAALRFVQLTPAPCALARIENGRIRWAVESGPFPGSIVKRRPVHARSVVAQLATRRYPADVGAREVPGEAWGAHVPMTEHVIAIGRAFGALTWIVSAE